MHSRYTVHVQADKLKDVIPVPVEFEHQELEVVISLPRKRKGLVKQYRGIFSKTKETIDQDLADMRNEWERNGE